MSHEPDCCRPLPPRNHEECRHPRFENYAHQASSRLLEPAKLREGKTKLKEIRELVKPLLAGGWRCLLTVQHPYSKSLAFSSLGFESGEDAAIAQWNSAISLLQQLDIAEVETNDKEITVRITGPFAPPSKPQGKKTQSRGG
jgi:hypothetical protein